MVNDQNPAPTTTARPKFWKTAFFMIGSAALGGVAVALWNRRELGRMRDEECAHAPEPSNSDEEAF